MAQTDPTKKKKATASSSKTDPKTDPKKGKRTSGTTTTAKKSTGQSYFSGIKKVVKVQDGVTEGKSGQSGSYLYYRKPSEKGFNVKTDREFVNSSGKRLAKNAGALPSKKK
jgi:hypothetical protein